MPNGTQAPATAEGPIQHTQNTAGALAIRPDQTQWTNQQAAVLRQSGIDHQVASEELSAFLHLCQRTRLDPFSRQIYLIGRWNNQQKRKVYTPQTSIDGYRVIAHRAATEAGHALGYEDTLWCAKDGHWRDVWLSDAPPAAAKVTVIRNGMRFSAVARYSEYAQTNREGAPSGLWGKMPATMTAKCAEALALRMAFPHDLAGVYTAEEMAQADNPAPQAQYTVTQERRPTPEATPQQPSAEQRPSTDQDTTTADNTPEQNDEGEGGTEPLEALMGKVRNSWNNALGMKQNQLEGKKLGVLGIKVPNGKGGSVELGDLMQNRIDQLEAASQERNAA